MLRLIGLGLGSPRYLTLASLEAMESCDVLLFDSYTGWVSEELRRFLHERFGGRVEEAGRDVLEDGAAEVVGEAMERDVGVLVPGDPLIATTHISLLVEAERRKVPWEIIYGVSIYSASASSSMLQAYKFGRTTTIPRDGRGIETCYRVIEENMERGLHTLILLDTAGGGLTAKEAYSMLKRYEEEWGRGVISEDRLAIALAQVGSRNEERWAGPLGRLPEARLPPPPHVLILPGKLHFTEEEALQTILKADTRKHKPHRYWADRIRNYIAKIRRVFDSMRISRDESKEVVKIAGSYLEDAERFLEKGDLFNSLGALAYCEGLLDALRMMGYVEFEWR